jgi:hypothetical protein
MWPYFRPLCEFSSIGYIINRALYQRIIRTKEDKA